MQTEIEIKYLEFPLIITEIKKLQRKLRDAEWSEDNELINNLKNAIKDYQLMIDLGEKYIVPF